MRIGILDDDPAICGMLRELLELTDHEVSVYNNPWDLLMVMFHSDLPDIIFDALIIDILLPDLAGGQVIQQIQEQFIDLPIIAISALPASVLDATRLKFPTLTVLKKPFALKELLVILETFGNPVQEITPPVS
jgi:DNA-binding response OmpR family regulator